MIPVCNPRSPLSGGRRFVALTALAVAAGCASSAPSVGAQAAAAPTPAPERPAPPPARPEDVESIDAIVTALYASISGPAGEARNWDRFRSLFAPGARLIPIARPQNGPPMPRVLSPDDYIRLSGDFLVRYGFTEKEIARRVERFGAIAHVFSTYEGRFQAPDAPSTPPRGINSIQLADDGTRWWVVTVFWDSERPGTPIPARYLTTVADSSADSARRP